MAFKKGDEEASAHVFGYNEAIGTDTETIWPGGGFIIAGGAATTMTFTSASGATDEDVKVLLKGLDGATWQWREEEVTLNSSGVGVTTNTFHRLYEASIVGMQESDGDITITNTSNSDVRLKVITGTNKSHTCIYTVPWGYTGYVTQINAQCSTTTPSELVVKYDEWIPYTGYKVTSKTIFHYQNKIQRDFIEPMKIIEGSSTELQGRCGTESKVSADFVILLDKN